MHSSLKSLTPFLALSLILAASDASAMPGRASAGAAPTARTNAAISVAGKVAEAFKSGGYSYVAVTQGDQRVWVACSPIDVVVGQEVAFQPGFIMRNFTSSSLGRTFETIVFTQGLAAAPAAASK